MPSSAKATYNTSKILLNIKSRKQNTGTYSPVGQPC